MASILLLDTTGPECARLVGIWDSNRRWRRRSVSCALPVIALPACWPLTPSPHPPFPGLAPSVGEGRSLKEKERQMESNSKQTKAVYTISENGERSFWNRVGTAFVNKDGSLNVLLNSLPVDGKLHIRDPKPVTEA